ncbi:hypothetical protein [Williamsia sp.]|uniref:hypothetical protein n=1 Tax=Williamsia sp. TaxID=1872085 RepID=UPI002F921ECA
MLTCQIRNTDNFSRDGPAHGGAREACLPIHGTKLCIAFAPGLSRTNRRNTINAAAIVITAMHIAIPACAEQSVVQFSTAM